MSRRELTPYGKAVKCRLIELNMTQVELAELVGTSKQYLGKILYGIRSGEMHLDSINRILGFDNIAWNVNNMLLSAQDKLF